MRVFGHHGESQVSDQESLDALLKTLDAVGGGEFWFSETAGGYPAMAVLVSGAVAEVHYFPEKAHPGLRYMNETDDLRPGEYTTFRYVGSDPAEGTAVPNEFVLSVTAAVAVVREFLARHGQLPSGEWFEL